MVYSNTAVYGRNRVGKCGHFSIFTSLKHFNEVFEVHFVRASFLHIENTDSIIYVGP